MTVLIHFLVTVVKCETNNSDSSITISTAFMSNLSNHLGMSSSRLYATFAQGVGVRVAFSLCVLAYFAKYFITYIVNFQGISVSFTSFQHAYEKLWHYVIYFENIKCVLKRASLALVSLLCKVLLITILPMKNTASSNGENKAHVK